MTPLSPLASASLHTAATRHAGLPPCPQTRLHALKPPAHRAALLFTTVAPPRITIWLPTYTPTSQKNEPHLPSSASSR